jgi:hypothetical protein
MVSDVSTLTELDPSDHHGVLSLQRAQPVNPVVPLTFTDELKIAARESSWI